MKLRHFIPLIVLSCLSLLLLASCAGNTVTSSITSPPTTTTSIPGSTTPSHLAEPVEIVSVIGPEEPYTPGGPSVTITLHCISDEPIVWLRASLELNKTYVFDFSASASNPFSDGDTSASSKTLINGSISDSVAYPLAVSGTFKDGWSFSFTKDVYITPRVTQPPSTTLEAKAIADYLNSAKDRYLSGISCGGSTLKPDLDLGEESFLSLEFSSNDVIQLDNRPFFYAAVPDYLGYVRGPVELPGYSITFSDPEPGVTRTGGGMAVVVRVSREGEQIGEEDYYDTVFNLFNKSVGVTTLDIQQVQVLSFYYKPDCENLEYMTLVLAPVPPPQQ